jgi:NADH dehydrogenase FAD-containing subunit
MDLPKKKQKVVILGSGWGALAMLKSINTNKFDVHLVSPRNYFMFTPLLADTTVGSVDTSRFLSFSLFENAHSLARSLFALQ